MKDFLFLPTEKDKRKYDLYIKEKCERNHIFIHILLSFYLLSDSVSTIFLIGLYSNFFQQSLLLPQIIRIFSHILLSILSLFLKKKLLKSIKRKKIQYLDFYLMTIKTIHLIIHVETENSLWIGETENLFVFMLIFTGLKITILEICFQVNYLKWMTKVFSIITGFIYVFTRLAPNKLIIPNVLAFLITIAILIVKLEKSSRREFLERRKFIHDGMNFKEFLDSVESKSIEKIFNSMDQGVLIMNKDLKIMKMNKQAQNYIPGGEEQLYNSKIIGYKEIPEFLESFMNEKINEKQKTQKNISPNKISRWQSIDNNYAISQSYLQNFDLLTLLNKIIKKHSKKGSISPTIKIVAGMKSSLLSKNQATNINDYQIILDVIFLNDNSPLKLKKIELIIIPLIRKHLNGLIITIKDISLSYSVTNLQLESSNKSKALAFVSHEIRTPLNCIIGMLNMMEPILNPTELDQYLYPAVSSAKFLLNLLNDLLDIAQIQAGKFKLVILDFNLKSLLEEIIAMIGVQTKAKGLALIFEFDPKLPKKIQSDPNRVRQIVTNLLGNALKFTLKGSITLKATCDPNFNNYIHILVIDNGIGIKDENKKNLFKAFGKLETNENEYLNSQGVGLGLLISNILAKNIGPDQSNLNLIKGNFSQGLNVTSEWGKGTTFRFIIEDKNETDIDCFSSKILPSEIINRHQINQIQKSKFFDKFDKNNEIPENSNSGKKIRKNIKFASSPVNNVKNNEIEIISDQKHKKNNLLMNSTTLHVESDDINTSLRHKKIEPCENGCPGILICDDDFYNLFILQNYLKETNFNVELAYNGLEVIEKVINLFENSKCCKIFRLILIDIEMPEKNGYEATKEIIEFYKNKGIFEIPPIVATTGHTTEEEAIKVKEAGMTKSISKPINKKDLLNLVEKLLILNE